MEYRIRNINNIIKSDILKIYHSFLMLKYFRYDIIKIIELNNNQGDIMKNTMYLDTSGKKCIVGIVDKKGNGYSAIEDNR